MKSGMALNKREFTLESGNVDTMQSGKMATLLNSLFFVFKILLRIAYLPCQIL